MVKPFLKWAGGKTRLLPEITSRLPHSYTRYFEPFVGGGSLFWYLEPDHAYIGDANGELINSYLAIKYNPSYLIADLNKHINTREYFFSLRNQDRQADYNHVNAIEKASRFIFLNKTGFNGWWNVNQQGHATIGYGYHKNPTIYSQAHIQACHEILQCTTILHADYRLIHGHVQKGDFVFFDPPYLPINGKDHETHYTKQGTNKAMHIELRSLCDQLDRVGVKWMLTNSATPFTRDLFSVYNLDSINVKRCNSPTANSRGSVEELIITNYDA